LLITNLKAANLREGRQGVSNLEYNLHIRYHNKLAKFKE